MACFQISQLANLTLEAQASIGRRLQSLMVFNFPDAHLDPPHPIYEALGLAFKEPIILGDGCFADVRHPVFSNFVDEVTGVLANITCAKLHHH